MFIYTHPLLGRYQLKFNVYINKKWLSSSSYYSFSFIQKMFITAFISLKFLLSFSLSITPLMVSLMCWLNACVLIKMKFIPRLEEKKKYFLGRASRQLLLLTNMKSYYSVMANFGFTCFFFSFLFFITSM